MKIIPPRFSNKLDPYQFKAATCGLGPKRCNAGAGSGKTTTYAHRIVYLIANGVKEESILATTFTKKAATEMADRIVRVGVDNGYEIDTKRMWIGTFHSLGIRACREYCHVINYKDNFTIDNDDQQLWAIKQLLNSNPAFKGMKHLKPYDVLAAISYARNAGMDYLECFEKKIRNISNHHSLLEIAADYEKQKRARNVFDYDDMMVYWLEILTKSHEARNTYQKQLEFILVDEYQDTNFVQNEIIDILAARSRNLFVVGDDYQCHDPETLIITPDGEKMIKDIQSGDKVLSATGQGAFDFCSVDNVFSRDTYEDMYEITTESGKKTRSTANHIFFSKLAPNDLYYVYLMYKKDYGFRIGKTKGERTTGKKYINGLAVRTTQESADYSWILETCDSEKDALYREAYLSQKYNIPQTMFKDRGLLTNDQIKSIFGLVIPENMLSLFKDYDLDLLRPHVVPQGTTKDEKKASVRMTSFCGKRKAIQVRLETSDSDILEKNYSTSWRDAKVGKRIEFSRHHSTYSETLLEARVLSNNSELMLVQSSKILKDSPFFYTPASHLRKGMVVPVWDNGHLTLDTITKVEKIFMSNIQAHKVYDLSVPSTRNYVAGGIVVHNSIYAFRAAEVTNIINFDKSYPDCETFDLENNYRSTPEIVEISNACISNNRRQLFKNVKAVNKSGQKPKLIHTEDERSQNHNIVQMIKGMHAKGLPYKKIAVLYKNNSMSVSLENELNVNLIPYVKKGAQFWKQAHLVTALSWLNLLQNPGDVTNMMRTVEIFKGVGKGAITDLIAVVDSPETFEQFIEGNLVVNAKKPKLYEEFRISVAKMEDILSESETPVKDVMKYIVEIMTPYTQNNWDDGVERAEDFGVLIDLACDFETIVDLLEAIAMQEENSKKKKDVDAVTLSTGHGAKGLEWDVVFIIGLVDLFFPSKWSVTEADKEEERRVLYVMLTRAKQRLYMFSPQSIRQYGETKMVGPSRFILELPPDTYEVRTL
jgi:DNA helicase-2/ATP-dependent DNA helicase PcrA